MTAQQKVTAFELLSVKEAARRTGLAESTIRAAYLSGLLKARRTPVVRIKLSDLEAWFDSLPEA